MGKNKSLVKFSSHDVTPFVELIKSQDELIILLKAETEINNQRIKLQNVLITNLELRKIDYEKRWFVFKPWKLFKK